MLDLANLNLIPIVTMKDLN